MKKSILIPLLLGIINISIWANSDNPEFTVDKGVIYCKSGIPEMPRWFADSRLAFEVGELCITRVEYFYKAAGYPHGVFFRQLWDGFRYYIQKDGLTYNPEYKNSKLYPFGIESEWEFEGKIFKHKMLAVDEAIIIQLTTPTDVPEDCNFKFDFYDAFGISAVDPFDYRFNVGANRKWRNWIFDGAVNTLSGGFVEGGGNDTVTFNCVLGADFQMSYYKPEANNKQNLISPALEPNKTYSFIITFDNFLDTAHKKSEKLIASLPARISAQYQRYQKISDEMPVLISPYKKLNEFFSLLPMYHESLKVTDYPGAHRAKTSNYWVWGIWDATTNHSSTGYWGDIKYIRDMLSFLEPCPSIAFQTDMQYTESSPSGMAMYIALLQYYYDQTQDIAVLRKHFQAASNMFEKIMALEVNNSGLIQNLSMFPDFRDLYESPENSVSSMNNSILYCATRSLNHIAAILGEKEVQKKTADIAKKIEQNFIKYFYDSDRKFIVTSVHKNNLVPVKSFHSSSLRWENDYYFDLIQPYMPEFFAFYEEHLLCKPGIRETPVWDMSYHSDANQMYCEWPVVTESYLRMNNLFDRKDLLEDWIKRLDYWYGHLTGPEGIDCSIETDKPKLDEWNTLKGTWTSYSNRTWYQEVVHSIVGVDADAGGITFFPYSGEEMKLLGMHYLGKTFDIEMKGSGPFIEYIEVNGMKISGTNKLPLECYKDKQHVSVTVKRAAAKQNPVIVKYGAGIVLKDYSNKNGTINAKLVGAGTGRLHFIADKAPVIKLDGKKINVKYNEQTKLATVDLTLSPDKDLAIGITP